MNSKKILSQIAEGFAICENERLNQVKTGNPKTFIRSFSRETCMPKAIQLSGELITMKRNEYTLLVSHNGIYEGVVFILNDATSYKYTGLNGVGHKSVLDDLGFIQVSTLELKDRKRQQDRKQPLKVKGAIAFVPQENTPKLPEYTYRKVFRPTGAVEGLVFRDGSQCYYYPGSERLALDAVVRELLDHGYAPYEEKKWKIFDWMQAEVYPLLFFI